jgi:hypothetical protein
MPNDNSPTNPHNTANPPPIGGVNLPPPALPGAVLTPGASAPAPTGGSTGTEMPASWPRAIDPNDAKVAALAMISDMQNTLQILEQIIRRLA